MEPLIEAIEKQSGQKPEGVVADSGYCSDQNLKYLAKKKLNGFVATEKLGGLCDRLPLVTRFVSDRALRRASLFLSEVCGLLGGIKPPPRCTSQRAVSDAEKRRAS
jgi:hypothetical protein